MGSSGAILSYIMCKGMNRQFLSVIAGGFGGETAAAAGGGEQKPVKLGSAEDAAYVLGNAGKVIIVPGYGMAVAGAQHKVWEMAKLLTDAGPTMDTQVAARLARAVGIYPPGTVVRLKNGETAMAVKRTLDPQAPVVRLVRSRDGVLTSTYSKRLTSKLAFAVTEEAGRSALPEGFDALQLWNPALERGED